MERVKYKGYELSASPIGYSVYLDNHCVAAGGMLGGGRPANVKEAKSAIRQIIAGTRKPLLIPAQKSE